MELDLESAKTTFILEVSYQFRLVRIGFSKCKQITLNVACLRKTLIGYFKVEVLAGSAAILEEAQVWSMWMTRTSITLEAIEIQTTFPSWNDGISKLRNGRCGIGSPDSTQVDLNIVPAILVATSMWSAASAGLESDLVQLRSLTWIRIWKIIEHALNGN